jgi:hypothetical protein
MTPPKCVLSEEDRLIEIGCVPGALLHLGTQSSDAICLKVEEATILNFFTINNAYLNK